jgi:hypothetical protein
LPNIILSDPPGAEPLGLYGRKRRAYLREHRPVLYSQLLLSERLYPLLREVDEAARQRLELADAEHRQEAEEQILSELVYG